MAAHYVSIEKSEFDDIFKSEKGWEIETSGHEKEIVYTKCLATKPWIKVKVYSSLKQSSGISRGVGKDAIRVCAVNIKTDRGVMKSRRINRVPGWNDRLINRVTEIWTELRDK